MRDWAIGTHQPNNSPAFPPHPQYRYRIYICIQRHFPSPSPIVPSNHPPPSASSHLTSSSPDTSPAVIGAMVRWLDNAGWSYVCSRNLGSSECLWDSGELQLPRSGLEHHPTIKTLAGGQAQMLALRHTLSIQNPPLRSIVSKNSSYSLLRKKSNLAISKLLQK